MATEAGEFKIERDYDARIAHARSMFNMDVQAAEARLDKALADAAEIRDGELADLRHQQHSKMVTS